MWFTMYTVMQENDAQPLLPLSYVHLLPVRLEVYQMRTILTLDKSL